MFKELLTFVFAAAAITASATEPLAPRTAVMLQPAGGLVLGPAAIAKRGSSEMVRSLEITQTARADLVRAAVSKTSPKNDLSNAEVPQEATPAVSWEMVLAALALMIAIALRRFSSGPR